jgi:hypothetical protein
VVQAFKIKIYVFPIKVLGGVLAFLAVLGGVSNAQPRNGWRRVTEKGTRGRHCPGYELETPMS